MKIRKNEEIMKCDSPIVCATFLLGTAWSSMINSTVLVVGSFRQDSCSKHKHHLSHTIHGKFTTTQYLSTNIYIKNYGTFWLNETTTITNIKQQKNYKLLNFLKNRLNLQASTMEEPTTAAS